MPPLDEAEADAREAEREAHLVAAKRLARAHLERGELVEAVIVMGGELMKRPDTEPNEGLLKVGLGWAFSGQYHDVERWIEGWR